MVPANRRNRRGAIRRLLQFSRGNSICIISPHSRLCYFIVRSTMIRAFGKRRSDVFIAKPFKYDLTTMIRAFGKTRSDVFIAEPFKYHVSDCKKILRFKRWFHADSEGQIEHSHTSTKRSYISIYSVTFFA